MDEISSPEFEVECEQFGRLLREYENALRTGDLKGREIFLLMRETWEHVVALAPKVGPKASPSPEMYLVLAFSHAIAVGCAAEAERLYGLLSQKERLTLDGLEAHEPGKYKIWLKSP